MSYWTKYPFYLGIQLLLLHVALKDIRLRYKNWYFSLMNILVLKQNVLYYLEGFLLFIIFILKYYLFLFLFYFILIIHYFFEGEEYIFIYSFSGRALNLYTYRKRNHQNKNSPFFPPLQQQTVQFSSFITYQWNAKLTN